MRGRRATAIEATKLTRTLLSHANVEDLLDMVARTVCESTGFVRSLIVDLDGVTGEVRGRAGHGVDAGIVASVHGAREEFPVIDMVVTRDAAIVLGPDELRAVVPAGYVERFEVDGLVVVQAMRSDRLGLLGVVFCDVGASVGEPTADDIRVVGELSSIAAVAFQHDLLVRRSMALQNLRDRSRFAAELHDGVTQQLYAAELELGELRDSAAGDLAGEAAYARLAQRLRTAQQQLRSAVAQIASGEAPVDFYDRARSAQVVERVGALVEELRGVDGPLADVELRGDGAEPDAERATVLVRAVREGLANVLKHAGATQVEIVIERGQDAWAVVVGDDGVGAPGLVAAALTSSGGQSFGLRSLSEEAGRLGGSLRVGSSDSLGGIELRVQVPLVGGR